VEDREVLQHISKLVEEERELRANAKSGVGLDVPSRERMTQLEIELDQCWDLLRRRQDREEFGEDPDVEEVRPASIVENYRQ
jgi:hypothetical protein